MRTLAFSMLLATAATGQPPPKAEPKPAQPGTAEALLGVFQPVEKPPAPGSVEEAIFNALRLHPDVKLAEAKVRMAEAEVEQAKSHVAQRVVAAFAKVELAKSALAPAEEYFHRMKNAGTPVEMLAANAQLQKAKAELLAAELELKAAKGGAPRNLGTPVDLKQEAAVEAGLRWLVRSQALEATTVKPAPAGTVADKLKAILDKPLKLDLKGADLDEAMAALLKAAGDPGLTVKLPTIGKKYLKNPPTVTITVEMPFTAAVQLIFDEINGSLGGVPQALQGRFEVYVREYGLFVAQAEDAPKDAPTLTEFARQVRAAKAGGR